jgi:bifunctional non-homologous end joining protein LigD
MVQYVLKDSKPRPRFIEPMECTRVARLPEGNDWLYEVKQDGYRVIGILDRGSAFLFSISGKNYTDEFPTVLFALADLRKHGDLVVDGEIVALDPSGRANFQELQNRRKTHLPIVYYVFDLLHWKAADTMNLPLEHRKQLLGKLAAHFRDPLRLNVAFATELPPLVEQVRSLGLEGIVAKRAGSLYLPGKISDAWQKHRFNQEGVFIIGGYVKGGRSFSSLIVGEYRGKDSTT